MKTTVVNIRKIKGVRPKFDIYIGREEPRAKLKASIWANPYTIKEYGIKESLRLYELHARNSPELMRRLFMLRGKILGCWCVNSEETDEIKCHGQILIRLIKELVI